MAQGQDQRSFDTFIFQDPLPAHSLCPSAPLPHRRPRITRPLSTPHYPIAELSFQNYRFNDQHCAQTNHQSCHLGGSVHNSCRTPFDLMDHLQPINCSSDHPGSASASTSHRPLASQLSASQLEASEGPAPVASEGTNESQQLFSPRAVASPEGAEFQQPLSPYAGLDQRGAQEENGARRFPETPEGSQRSYQLIGSATRDRPATPFLRAMSHDGFSHTAGRSSDAEVRLFEQDRVRARRLLMGVREWSIAPGAGRFGHHGSRSSSQPMSGSPFPRPSLTRAEMDRQRNRIAGGDGRTSKISAFEVSAATMTLERGCGICLDEFGLGEEGVVMIDVCRHFFHHACLVAWFEESTTCPFCRINVN